MSSGINSIYSQDNINSPNTNSGGVYEFDRFRLDSSHLMLYENEKPVSLAPKVIETLLTLVERRGDVVSKEEMIERLWADSFVEESNLTQNIYLLRKTLGKAADGQDLIETFRRRGYRFNGEMKSPAAKTETLANVSSVPENRIGQNFALDLDSDRFVFTETTTRTIVEQTIVSDDASTAVAQISSNAGKKRIWIWTLAGGAILILATGLFWRFGKTSDQTAFDRNSQISQTVRFERLMPNISTRNPAISPGGEFVAYSKSENGGEPSLWLKNLSNGDDKQLLPPLIKGFRGIQFSPDGKQIYFLTNRVGGENNIQANIIARIPLFGGAVEETVENVLSWFAISPDGKLIAFVRDSDLIIADANKGGERVLARRDGKIRWFASQEAQPAWSPDGSRVIVAGGYAEQGTKRAELIEISIADGTEKRVAAPNWDKIGSVVWLANEPALLVIAREEANKPSQIWRLTYPNGAARVVTNDLNNYNSLSVSADSRRLVTEQVIGKSDIWLASTENPRQPKQLTFGDTENIGVSGIAFTPDNKIIYTSPQSGNLDLWRINADGSSQKQLTRNTGSWNGRPRVSPDNQFIVFQSFQDKKNQIWRIDADGGNPLPLTDGSQDSAPCFSADGKWVYFTRSTDESLAIEKVSITGGESVPLLTDFAASAPSVSPDGKLLAFEYLKKDAEKSWKLGVMSLEDSKSIKLFDVSISRRNIGWTADSKTLLYIQSGSPNLWQKPISDEPPRQLTHFDLEQIWSFAVSNNQQQIAFARGNVSTETVLINLF